MRRSSGNGGQCVEVATNVPDLVVVRDGKDREGPNLLFLLAQGRAFIGEVKVGRFDDLA
ncbi:DUF397 domain-containing protein [Streptosporangium sp. NPDC050855]|uniref:DUF397 domain-containing protein n=1 Tax=Streptosporangium sp. NPDC050855 TaxID=3366194 RepID=UPI0037B8B5EB